MSCFLQLISSTSKVYHIMTLIQYKKSINLGLWIFSPSKTHPIKVSKVLKQIIISTSFHQRMLLRKEFVKFIKKNNCFKIT